MNDNSSKPMTEDEIRQTLINKYIDENNAVTKRLDEQIVSQNIMQTNEGYQITNQGKLLIRMYKVVSDLFGINKKNISL
jgi:hypothetical protein